MSALRRHVLTLLPKVMLSRLTGWLTAIRLPRRLRAPVFRLYSRRYGVELDEVDRELAEFASLAEFFQRPLRAGARPIEGADNDLVSPVDGRLVCAGRLDGEKILQVKGWTYDLGEFLDGLPGWERFRDGDQLTLYLAPGDCHRIHSPCGGRITAYAHVPGTLFPVNPPAVASIPRVFCRNERVAVLFEETPFGALVLVAVGALNVGSIRLHVVAELAASLGREASSGPLEERKDIARGQELGAFGFGSTVVVIGEPGRLELLDLQRETPVRIGQCLARARRPVPAP